MINGVPFAYTLSRLWFHNHTIFVWNILLNKDKLVNNIPCFWYTSKTQLTASTYGLHYKRNAKKIVCMTCTKWWLLSTDAILMKWNHDQNIHTLIHFEEYWIANAFQTSLQIIFVFVSITFHYYSNLCQHEQTNNEKYFKKSHINF